MWIPYSPYRIIIACPIGAEGMDGHILSETFGASSYEKSNNAKKTKVLVKRSRVCCRDT